MKDFWAVLIIIPIITWYSMFGIMERNYKMEQQDVENIVYQYTQIAAKKGILYRSVFEEMSDKLAKYGEFETYLCAEKFEGESADPIKLEGWDVIDADLRAQGYDIINIYVIYKKRHPLSVIHEFTVLGVPNGQSYDFRLGGKASVYIQ